MLHFHPLDQTDPIQVQGDHAKGVLRIDLTSISGEVDEYELTVEQARKFAQRLFDSASAMTTFLSTRPRRVT